MGWTNPKPVPFARRVMLRLSRLIGSNYHRRGPKTKILLVSLHKSGTHLVRKVLELTGLERIAVRECNPSDFHGLAPNQYLATHSPFGRGMYGAIEDRQVKVIFNFRDPRDVCVSKLHYQHPNNDRKLDPRNEFLKNVFGHACKDDDERLDAIIRGEQYIPHMYIMGEQFRVFRGLLFHPHVHKARFEDLIGPQGGGDVERQLESVRALFEYLEFDVDPESIARQAFDNKSETFRKGQIGQWRHTFKQRHIDLFNQLHGDLLRDYDYE